MSYDIADLEVKAAAALEEARTLGESIDKESRAFTEDEDKKYKALMTENQRCLDAIERAKEIEKRHFVPTEVSEGVERPLITEKTPDKFRHLGEQLQAIMRAEDSRGREWDNRLNETRAATGANETVDSAGGFLVQTDFSAELLKRAHETGILANRVRKIPISANANRFSMPTVDESSRADGSRWGGIRVYRTAEAGSYTASKPAFGEFSLKLEKMTGLMYVTDELKADSTALGSVMSQGFGEEFGYKIDNEIINGSGAGQMLGIYNAPCLVSITKETGQAADTIVTENIMKMFARFEGQRANGVWLVNRDAITQLMQLKLEIGTGGQLLWMPAGGLAGNEYDMLFGMPVLYLEQCQTLGDKGDIYLADFSKYIMIEKSGMEAASSIHVNFTSGEEVFRFTMRNNGAPIFESALTPANSTDTVSPFVTLNERA